MGLLPGMIVLVRPVNGIILFALPFLAGSWAGLKAGISSAMRHKLAAVGAVLLAAMVFMVQPLIYYTSTGQWWVDSYPGEHFNWADPHPLAILFSYKKGLFVYTPICLLACAGLAYLYRRSHWSLASWSAFMALLTYVLSSWWNWWYGGSFSARPYVEYLSFFAIPLGLGLQQFRGAAKHWYLAAIVLLTCLCQVQTMQARYFRIHYEDMDRARYWGEFLRIDKLD